MKRILFLVKNEDKTKEVIYCKRNNGTCDITFSNNKTYTYKNIEIHTVHKYQGREKEIVILSTVSDKADEFMDGANLLNVAISRAENKLIIVVSDDDFLTSEV